MPKDILGRPVLTAAELDDMTPEQRQAAFDASIVTDLEQLPLDYLTRLRVDALIRLARREAPDRAVRRQAAARDVPNAS